MKNDILAVQTVTLAMKARKALSKQGIKSEIIKIDSAIYQNGCSYGIELNSHDFFSAVSTMRDLGITFKHITKDIQR